MYSHTETPVKHTTTGRVRKVINRVMNKVRSPAASTQPKHQNGMVQNTDEDDVTIEKTVHDATPENQDKLQIYKSHLEKQMRENKQLQDNLREMMCQSKLLKTENEKLKKVTVDLKTENETLQSKLKVCEEQDKETKQQIKALKSSLAKESGENLIKTEENNKLKKRVDMTTKEKEKLLDQLMQCSTSTDSVENKIESEIQYFKDTVLEELREIKSKIDSSRAIQTNLSTSANESRQ